MVVLVWVAIGLAGQASAADTAKEPTFYLEVGKVRPRTAPAPGEKSVESDAAEVMRDLLSAEIRGAYPCAKVSDDQDLRDKLDEEKRKQLAGTAGEGGVSDIGTSMNADYLTNISVQSSDKVSVIYVKTYVRGNPNPINVATAELDIEDTDAIRDTLDALAKNTAQEIADRPGAKRCKPGGWKGTFNVVTTIDHTWTNNANVTVTEKGGATLSCVLAGDDQSTRCSFSSSLVTGTHRGSMSYRKSASEVEVPVVVSFEEENLKIGYGDIPVTETITDTFGTPNLGTSSDEISGQDYLLPRGPDPNRQSGSWSNPNPELKKMGVAEVVTWSLTR